MWERKEKKERSGRARQIFEAFMGKKGHCLSSSFRQRSGALLLEVIVPIVKQGGMFGRLSGKHHFRAHSCHSPGT